MKREVLQLVLLILTIDAGFIGFYFAAGLAQAAPMQRLGYTMVWTFATLLVVLRGLSRMRAARLRRRRVRASGGTT